MVTVDVTVIGGGPAGCAVALTLYRNSPTISCIVLDNADPSDFKIGESLPSESGRLLQYLDPSLPKQLSEKVSLGTHTTCSGNASAWASSILEERHSILNPFGEGYHLNRSDFDESLRSSVIACDSKTASGLRLQKGTFKKIERTPTGLWAIDIEVDGEVKNIVTKWVVDATGRKASVATKIDAQIVANNPLLAFYAVLTAESDGLDESDHDTRTLIEATAEGWWYSSLISHNPSTRVVVFHTLPTHPAAKASRRPNAFLDRLHTTSIETSSIITKWDYNIQPMILDAALIYMSNHWYTQKDDLEDCVMCTRSLRVRSTPARFVPRMQAYTLPIFSATQVLAHTQRPSSDTPEYPRAHTVEIQKIDLFGLPVSSRPPFPLLSSPSPVNAHFIRITVLHANIYKSTFNVVAA